MHIKENTAIEIFVCFHDLKQLPKIKKIIKGNKIYKPIFLGNSCEKESEDYYCENNGKNIAHLNPYISEMSGIYWMCKNSKADIIGLDHYRRYFINRKYFGKILDEKFVLENLKDNDLLIHHGTEPLRGTNYDLYGNKEVDDTFEILKKLSPEYTDSFNEVINADYPLSFFNMFVGDKKIINEYMEWVLPILEELINTSSFSNPRIVGVMGEFLFNVYIHHNNLKYKWVHLKVTEDSNLKIRMFFSKIGFVRFFFKNIYYPLKDKL